MGTYQTFGCNACKRQVELGGPEEFRRTKTGALKEVPHPAPSNAKIDGLWIVLWCPACRKSDRKILLEFVKPSSPIEVWGRLAPIKPEYQQEDDSRYQCACGRVMDDEIEEGPCPWCAKGRIEPRGIIKT